MSQYLCCWHGAEQLPIDRKEAPNNIGQPGGCDTGRILIFLLFHSFTPRPILNDLIYKFYYISSDTILG